MSATSAQLDPIDELNKRFGVDVETIFSSVVRALMLTLPKADGASRRGNPQVIDVQLPTVA